MKDEYKEVLRKLGYNIKKDGFAYFVDLIEDVRCLLREFNGDENKIRDLLPSFYLEYYHFVYEVGRKIYMYNLYDFYNSRSSSSKKNKLGSKSNLESELIMISKYFNYLEDNDIQINKNVSKRKILKLLKL